MGKIHAQEPRAPDTSTQETRSRRCASGSGLARTQVCFVHYLVARCVRLSVRVRV